MRLVLPQRTVEGCPTSRRRCAVTQAAARSCPRLQRVVEPPRSRSGWGVRDGERPTRIAPAYQHRPAVRACIQLLKSDRLVADGSRTPRRRQSRVRMPRGTKADLSLARIAPHCAPIGRNWRKTTRFATLRVHDGVSKPEGDRLQDRQSDRTLASDRCAIAPSGPLRDRFAASRNARESTVVIPGHRRWRPASPAGGSVTRAADQIRVTQTPTSSDASAAPVKLPATGGRPSGSNPVPTAIWSKPMPRALEGSKPHHPRPGR